MNILVDDLPTSVTINGETYELNTNFKDCLKIIVAFEDPELTQIEKQVIMLSILYKEMPSDIEKAHKAAIEFLNCGDEFESGIDTNDGIGRLYSFEKDSKYIFSAILQTYGIDLEQKEYLHWWKFVNLFFDLNENCFFNRLVYLRRQKKLGKLTKDELQQYNNLGDIVELPEEKSTEEKEQISEFLRLLGESKT